MAFRQYVRRFRAFSNVAKKSLKFGAAVVVGAVVYSKWKGSSILHAAWTTGYEPSVKWDYNWDSRDPEYKKQPQVPTASRHILLIRHGDCAQKGGFWTGYVSSQADLTGQRLKKLNLSYTILISSTKFRAKETAKRIRGYLPDHVEYISDASLREGVPIPSEPPVGRLLEKEQFHEDGARIESAFRKYFYRADANQKEDSYEIIVCHANVIRYFICRALQFPGEAWKRLRITNCSISQITIKPNGLVVLRMMGDHGHIHDKDEDEDEDEDDYEDEDDILD